MDLGLQGKTALVLGGGGGLGSAIARQLATEGTNVAIGDIDPAAVEKTVASLSGGKGLALPWDLAALSVIDANIAKIEAALGPVDILVNNTGGHRRPRPPARIRLCGPKAFSRWCCR